jgi:drug/metabolite transporter (DMT)-like permease
MWIIYAVGASVVWGLSYVFNAQSYKHISVLTTIGLTTLFTSLAAFVGAYLTGAISTDMRTLMTDSRAMAYIIAAIGTGLLGEFLISFSIAAKNPTLAGMIEVSYPIFIALFSYLFFREAITVHTFIGGVLIFLGIFIISYTQSAV